MPRSEFRRIHISGDAVARGTAYGEQAADLIQESIAVYRALFDEAGPAARETAERVRALVLDFEPAYAHEMDAIAQAAQVDRWWIYALNARTEILNMNMPECTSALHTGRCELAQTWDWLVAMQPLVVELDIQRPDGHRIVMLCEAGQIGKIGMNNAGLGVGLNILFCRLTALGLPVHILMRAMLDTRSAREARALVERAPAGRASNLMVADAAGRGWCVEFADTQRAYLDATEEALVHTNHYQCFDEPAHGVDLRGSRLRQSVAEALLDSSSDLASMLDSKTNGDDAICSPHHHMPPVGLAGTLFSVVMDLKARTLRYRPGNQTDAPWQTRHLGDAV